MLQEGKEMDDDDDSLDDWKPSVYWVMLCLVVASIVVAGCASLLYCPLENWDFFESLYFCFVSFSTIGKFFEYIVKTHDKQYYVHRISWNFK